VSDFQRSIRPALHPALRAYRDVIGLYAASAGASAWGSSIDFARLCGADPGAWTTSATQYLYTAGAVGSGLWLVCLIITRSRGVTRARSVLAQVLAVGVVALVDLTDRTSVQGELAALGLMVWLSGEVLLRHGFVLGARTTGGSVWCGVLRGLRVGLSALAFFVLTGFFMGVLSLYGHGPMLRRDQADALGLDSDLLVVAHTLWTAGAEELVCTVAVVLLLRAGHRPTWEWTAVPVVLRLVPHLYLGIIAIPIALTAVGAIYLYVRHRRIAPQIAAHVLYDVHIFDLLAHLVPNLFARAVVVCVAVAAVTWADAKATPSAERVRPRPGVEPRSGEDLNALSPSSSALP
jgi:hypothetical protein